MDRRDPEPRSRKTKDEEQESLAWLIRQAVGVVEQMTKANARRDKSRINPKNTNVRALRISGCVA